MQSKIPGSPFFNLFPQQLKLRESVRPGLTLLHGEAGSGKTSAALAWLAAVIQAYPGEPVMVLTPLRTLAQPYRQALAAPEWQPLSPVSLQTIPGLVRRMVALFWPFVGRRGGFDHPYAPPRFLTVETAQYYMGRIVAPLIDEGYFSTVTLQRNRLYSQLLDNLNKSALVGFPHTQIGQKLQEAWTGDPARLRVFEDVQTAISLFRRYCLENNLLDFSLQVEMFRDYIWHERLPHEYITGQYRHLIYDNIEEDTPFAHDLLQSWLPDFTTALLVMDDAAGYRRFLGADPRSAQRFVRIADQVFTFSGRTNPNAELDLIKAVIAPEKPDAKAPPHLSTQKLASVMVLPASTARFFPQVLEQTAQNIRDLVAAGTPPHEIAVLSPYISDALTFGLTNRLTEFGIPVSPHRPALALKDQPAVATLLTLTALAYPEWSAHPDFHKAAQALSATVQGLDLVRATLITEKIQATLPPPPAEQALEALNERVPRDLLQLTGKLLDWLRVNGDPDLPYDLFLSSLFGDVLSRPGFSMHTDLSGAKAVSNLIESFQKFSQSFEEGSPLHQSQLNPEFIRSVADGIISAQYLTDWDASSQTGVLITPVLTFLMQNRPVDYQFWLNLGSSGWYQRLEQPLTHPYVLSRNWLPGRKWTAEDELALSMDNLDSTLRGLIARCRRKIYLEISTFGESGTEERGLLLTRMQALFRQALKADPHD